MSTSPSAGQTAGRHAADVAAAPGTDLAAERTLAHAAAQGGDAGAGPSDDIAELRQEIDQTRERLGDTVEQLAAKADVKAQANARAAKLAGEVKDKAGEVKDKIARARAQAAARARSARDQLATRAGGTGAAANSAGDLAGQQVARVTAACAGLWQAAPEPARQAVSKAATSARQRRAQIAAAAGVLVLGGLIRSRRKRR